LAAGARLNYSKINLYLAVPKGGTSLTVRTYHCTIRIRCRSLSSRLGLSKLDKVVYEQVLLLYHFIQFACHASHPISENPCNNFFSILADFGDFSEKLKSHVIRELNEMVQYKFCGHLFVLSLASALTLCGYDRSFSIICGVEYF
jgi:hypothetical protein